MPRLSLQVALGVGAAGALVDVSSYARLDDGLRYRWGRDDAFNGVEPGTFSFVLDNADGRFTPENASSPLTTKLSEGARACVSVGGRLTAGTVRSVEPEFPGGAAAWATVRVTCEDGLGDAGRAEFPDVTRGAAFGVGCGGFWPFDDVEGSSSFRGVTGRERALYVSGQVTTTLEVDPSVIGNPPQVTFTTDATGSGDVRSVTAPGLLSTVDYADGQFVSVWVTPRNYTSSVTFTAILDDGVQRTEARFGIVGNQFFIFETALPGDVYFDGLYIDTPYYLTVSADNRFWVNGELVYTGSPLSAAGGNYVEISFGTDTSVSVSGLSITDARTDAGAAAGAPNATMYELVGQTTGLSYAAAPSDLSESQVGTGDFSGSALDLLNLYLMTEQGDAYITTTGTLTAPTATLNMRPRNRPSAVDYTFDVGRELSGAPEFIRDLTNLVSRVTVEGPNRDTIVDDSTLVARAGRASSSDTVMLLEDRDRTAWGQDRLIRGANTKLRIASVVVDAMTTPTDRSADLLALVPGDRVQFTGLPSTVLGFDTWDGWFLGADERHSTEAHEFLLHFTPVLPDAAVYNDVRTNLWPNPSAETTAAGWTVFGSLWTQTLTTTQGLFGAQSLQYVRATTATDAERAGFFGSDNGPAGLAVMSAGSTYTGSAYVRSDSDRYLTIGLNFRTAAGAGISDVIAQEVFVPANTWTRLSVTAVAPATTGLGGVRIRQGASGDRSYTNGVETMWLDGCLVEEADTVLSYFDGSTTSDAFTYAWTGTAHASTSTQTWNDPEFRYVDEVLILDGGINDSVTTIDINTSGDFLTTTDLPLTIQIDDEQMTVTACTLGTPQLATVTRGVNGTTAASHLSGAAVTVLPDSIYAF